MWNEIVDPPVNGWPRLSAKLARAEADQLRETIFWRRAAGVMVVAMVLTLFPWSHGPSIETPKMGEVLVEQGHAVAVPGMPAGIRFFWVLN